MLVSNVFCLITALLIGETGSEPRLPDTPFLRGCRLSACLALGSVLNASDLAVGQQAPLTASTGPAEQGQQGQRFCVGHTFWGRTAWGEGGRARPDTSSAVSPGRG